MSERPNFLKKFEITTPNIDLWMAKNKINKYTFGNILPCLGTRSNLILMIYIFLKC